MAFLVLVLVVVIVGVVVWRGRTSGQGRVVKPAGLVASLVDKGFDALAPLYPSRPLSRRALPRRLLRAAEQTITIGVSGTVLVPSHIRIAVNPEDLAPFTEALEWLRRDIAEALRLRAEQNGWIVPSGPEIVIVGDEERPLRLPRAVGRLDAFRLEHVRTPPLPGEAPDPASARAGHAAPRPAPPGQAGPPVQPGQPAQPGRPGRPGNPPDAVDRGASAATGATRVPRPPDATGRTSLVVGGGDDHEAEGPGQPTVPVQRSVHLRLVDEGQPRTGGPNDLNMLLVEGAPLVVGRSREADLQVRDSQVSARHCTLSIGAGDGPVTITDMGSTNGTFVDGERVSEAALRDGQRLRLGGSTWRVAVDPVTS